MEIGYRWGRGDAYAHDTSIVLNSHVKSERQNYGQPRLVLLYNHCLITSLPGSLQWSVGFVLALPAADFLLATSGL